MQNNYNDLEFTNKLLCNSLLFASILKKKTPEEKIKKIKKYLERGADINAIEANYKNNTPLHLAVIKEEPEIVEFLLENGAQFKKKNYDGKSALDLAHSPSGNLIKRKEIITLLETFADNNLKHVNSNVNINKPPKRPGCPFIINVTEVDSEETSNIRDSKDFRECFNQLSASVGEDNTNTAETKSLVKNVNKDAIKNYFDQPHSSKDLILSSPDDTNPTLTEEVNAKIAEVTMMLENLDIRGVTEPGLNQTAEYDKQEHRKEGLKIPSRNQGPDILSTQESNPKTSDNKDSLVKENKLVGNKLKQPQRKISYIQKNMEAISKKANQSKISKDIEKKYIKEDKPTENRVTQLQNNKKINVSSSSKNTIGADYKTSKEKNLSSAKNKNPLKKDVNVLKESKDFKMCQQESHSELSSLQKNDSQTPKNKIDSVKSPMNCDIKRSSAVIGTRTRIDTERKASSIIHNKPVGINVKQPRQSKYLKISSSPQDAENILSQKRNTNISKNNEVNEIFEVTKRKEDKETLIKMKEPVKNDSSNSKDLKISSNQYQTKAASSKNSSFRSLAENENITIVEGIVITDIDSVTNTNKEKRVGSVKDSKCQPNDFIQPQECKDLKIPSIQQDAADLATFESKSTSSTKLNEENKMTIESAKVSDVGVERKTAKDKKVGLGDNKKSNKKPQDTKDCIITSNERGIVDCLSHSGSNYSDLNKMKNNKDIHASEDTVIRDISQASITTNNESSVQIDSLNLLKNSSQKVKFDLTQECNQTGLKKNDNHRIVENPKISSVDSEIISNKENKSNKEKTVGLNKDLSLAGSDLRQEQNIKDLKKKTKQQQYIESISIQESDSYSSQSKNKLFIIESKIIDDVSGIPVVVSVNNENKLQKDVKQSQDSKSLNTFSSQQQTEVSYLQQGNSQLTENKRNNNIVESTVISDNVAVTTTSEINKSELNNDLQSVRDSIDFNISSDQEKTKAPKSSKNNNYKKSKTKETNKTVESPKVSDDGDETKMLKKNKKDLVKREETVEIELKQTQCSKDLEISSTKQEIERSSILSENNDFINGGWIDQNSDLCDTKNKTYKENLKAGLAIDKNCKQTDLIDSKQTLDTKDLKMSSGQQCVNNNPAKCNTVKSDKPLKDNKNPKTCSSQQSNETTQKTKANSKKEETKTHEISSDNKGKKKGPVKDKKVVKNDVKQESSSKKSNKKKVFLYPKRTGTSGLSGQLYETKLLSLILLRSLYVQEVPKFFIGTNADNMGAFDDVVFRYYSGHDQKPSMMFLQAKHKDNPAKEKFTVEELKKVNGDFSLNKYLESYIKISQMFTPDTGDDMFTGEFKKVDCEFIIYTSAFENFSKIKEIEQSKVKSFINTPNGKVFQFNYDEEDVENLIVTVVQSRAVLLAKRVSRFIFKDNNNYNNMMMDELIKTYHVYLARHIINVQLTDEESPNFYHAKFRESFLASNDTLLRAFRNTLCKEAIQIKKNIGMDNVEEVAKTLKSLSFKVPINFGNLNFCFTGNDEKKKRKLEYLSSLFKRLFEIAEVSIDKILIKIDDDNVGPNENFQSTDFESYRIGGLVGNQLILDENTMTLKFNFDLKTLSPDNIKLLDRLRDEVFLETDPTKYRFDINVHQFARLSLVHEKHDKGQIKDFLDKLIFYTNQATEDKVEEIVKKEIDGFFVGNIPRQRDQLFKVKSHAIFLKAHDLIQKWWKISDKAPYLTESCQYFLDAEQDVINSPLLNILNFTYTKTVKNTMCEIKFKDVITDFFHFKSFLEDPVQIMMVTTEESALTSLKLIQNFKENHYSDYIFIDLDYIANSNYFADVKVEIKESKIQTLIIVCKSENIFAELNLLIKHFKGKVIIISKKDLIPQIEGIPIEKFVSRVGRQIGFEDLDDTMCETLRNERYIVFQGKEVKLGVLFEDKSYQLLNSNVLYNILNNESTIIGRNFNNPSYDEILDYYIKERVCRYVTLEKNIEASDDLDIVEYNKLVNNFKPNAKDIVLTTDNEEEYVHFSMKYQNCNVHWFRNGESCLVWQQSQGNLSNLLKHVKRNSHDTCRLQLETLKDLKEKVVIISAEPGMGKSSLLTHLAINTKDKYPTLWISKINLLDFINEFKSLKQNKINIDFKEVVKFLFRAIGFKASKDKTCNFELIIDQVSVKDRDISLNVDKEGNNVTGLNLFEVQLFVHCFNTYRVALLFDGFDEICPDYATEFMQIANILRNSKLAHLWITSRLYNVLHQLESVMQTFSFTIEPLSEDDQTQFLEKIWSTKKAGKVKILNNFPYEPPWLKLLVKGFLTVLSAVLSDINSKFISMPLHLYMIAEIFQDSYHTFPLNAESYESFISEQNTMNQINLNQMYERFIDIKFFKIRFGEKKPLLCINDPDMRKLIENERDTFFYNHKIIAAYVVFGKMDDINFFDKNDTKQIHDFIKRIKLGEEKTGIIEQIVISEPKFVHYTFAEYFATEFLCDRLKAFQCRSYMWTYLINTFLESDVGGPQRFFNAKLGNHPNLYDVIDNTELKPMFENWLEQHEKMAKLIFMSVDQYLENTALFLLKCIKYVLTNTNLNDFIKIVSKSSNTCILCIATKRNAVNVVTFIIDTVKNVNASRIIDLFNCCDLPYSNPLLIAYGPEKWDQLKLVLLNKFLSDLEPQVVVEVFCMQFDKKWFNRIKSKKYIHIVSESLGDPDLYFFNRALDKLTEEQLLQIFTIKDSDNKLAAHRAASSQSYKFFDKLESLVNKDDFKKICMTRDMSGLTPLHYFGYTSEDSDKLECLLDKVYADEKTGKLTLKYFIDERSKSK